MEERMGVTFLFGAGADSNYGICQGSDFREPLLTDKFKEEREMLLGDDMGGYQFLYPASRRIYYQTIASHKEEAEIALKACLTKDEFEAILVLYGDEEASKEMKRDAAEKVESGIKDKCKKWYEMLTNPKENEKGDPVRNFFLNNAVFFDALDGKLNDLRNPKLHSNGKRVINAYVTIFILMMQNLYEIDNDFTWNYKDVFDLLKRPYKKTKIEENSYYKILCEQIGDSKPNFHISTTNYTSIVEDVLKAGGKCPDVAYLHGRLTWFEDREYLTIYDCTQKNEREQAIERQKYLIPFILIPSGVKPLICTRQIREFGKFINQLDDSNILCVVGYRFNSEDNHINGIIADWLRRENTQLIYFNYNKDVDWTNVSWKKAFDKQYECESAESAIEMIGTNVKILNLPVNKDTSQEGFREIVQAILK